MGELMQAHVRRCDGDRYICMLCAKTISSYCIRRHLREVHIGARVRYRCPPCGKEFANRRTIYSHVRVTHKDWKGVDLDSFMM